MRKYSRQRESIKNYLATHSNHPTAETVYLSIKEEYPNISLGTVYRNLSLLEETGEIITKSSLLEIDEDKLREDEALDGYYVLATSEYEENDDKIIEMYRGLWKIEESFKVTKSDLEARPVYVSREDHIEAHFLTCFLALIIARILEMKTDHKYSIGKLLESLRKCECSHVSENYYLFDYYDEVLRDIGNQLEKCSRWVT